MMTEPQTLLISVAYKSSLILGILTALILLAGRRWPRGCSVWKRVGIAALLILPLAVCLGLEICIPVLPPASFSIANKERIVTGRDLSRSSPTPSEDGALFQISSNFQCDRLNAIPKIRPSIPPTAFVPQPRPAGDSLIIRFALLYGFVVSILLTKLVRAWRGLERLKQSSPLVADAEWQVLLARWAEVLQIKRPIELRVSNEVSVPMTFGWRSPVILVPPDCLLGCDQIQREAILIHELTHIANGDFLWQILTHLMASLYWLHPLGWLVRREVEILRERLSDSLCSQHLGPNTYVRALLQIAARTANVPAARLGMAMAQRSSLRRRLNELDTRIGESSSRSGRVENALVLGTAVGALGLIVVGMLTVRVPPPRWNRSAVSDRKNSESQLPAEGTMPQVSSFVWHEAATGFCPAPRLLEPSLPLASASHEASTEWEDDTEIFNAQVAATVNGEPILNGAVLDRYASYLISVREQMQTTANDLRLKKRGETVPTVEDYKKICETLIQRDIATHIQKTALVQFAKADLTPDRLIQMNSHIDQLFEKECDRLKRELKVTTMAELEQDLRNKGTTLEKVKAKFALDRLSVECFVAKSDPLVPIEATEVLAYYESHGDLFDVPRTVTWQKTNISILQKLSDAEAEKLLEQVLTELNLRDSLDLVESVARYSKQMYDEMLAGSLVDVELEKQLFSMPLNQWSHFDKIDESPKSLCVVRVTARQDARRQTIEEVQDEIRQTLFQEQNKTRGKKLLKKLFSTIKIETQYSLPQFVPDEPKYVPDE